MHLKFKIAALSLNFFRTLVLLWVAGNVKFLLAQDVLELASSADGEQQCPGQQSVGVKLAHLGTDGRRGTVRP